MRVLASVVLVCLAGAAALAGGSSKKKSENRDLNVVEYTDGRFKAMLGDESETSTRTVGSAAGPLTVTTHTTAVSKDFSLSVTWTDYPGSFKDVPAETLLAAVRDGMKTRDCKLTETRLEAMPPNPPGKELVIDYRKYVVRSRVYLAGSRLYLVSATGKKDDVEGHLARQFLASFEILH